MAWRVLPLLEGLTADEVSQIFEISNFRFFKAGDELLAEGQDAHSFFLIEEGEVEISRQRETEISPMSRSVVLARPVSLVRFFLLVFSFVFLASCCQLLETVWAVCRKPIHNSERRLFRCFCF